MKDTAELFKMIVRITDVFGVNIYINVNMEVSEEVPACIREYVA